MTAPTAPPLGTVAYAPLVVRHYLLQSPVGPPLLGDGVRVCTEAPADRPPLLVRITSVSTADGGNIVLSWRRVTIYCSATGGPQPEPHVFPPGMPAEVQAGELAEMVLGHIKAAEHVAGNGIRAVNVVGTPARQDDPDEDIPRFQLTVDVLLRARH
jgi:hypothetical protein